MNNSSCFRRPGRLASWVVGLFLVSALLIPLPAAAADPDFVGVLWLLEDREVAEELGLDDAQKQKLLELILARESDALELALQLRSLSAGERMEKLGPFRRQSEEKGLALLTDAQRTKLEQIRVRRLGLASLAEPAIAERLKLETQQRDEVAQLLRQRADRLAKEGKDRAHVVQSEIERKLAAVLTPPQTAAWDAMIAAAAAKPAAAAAEKLEEPTAGPPLAADHAAATDTADSPAPFPDDTTAKPDETAAKPDDSPTQPDDTAAAAETVPEAMDDTTPGPAAADQVVETPPEQGDTAAPDEPGKTEKMRFSFRFQPWAEVLQWFADQADLSLVMDAPPAGTFNYTDDHGYTPAEAIDLLNSVLLTKGYTLIRRNRMLMLINLEDGIPPNLVPTISIEDLDTCGEYELVSVLFQLEKLSPEEIEPEIKKVIGPQGSVVALPKARQILVTETAGRLRAIRRTIQRSEDPEGRDSREIRPIEIKYADPEEALAVVRQFLDIPPEQNASADGSIRIVTDATGAKLLVSGTPEKMARVSEVLKAVDVPEAAPPPIGVEETPQLEVYTIAKADPESVLQVMQTLLAGSSDARLALDPKTGNLVALARPAEQATIQATLEQMQRDSRVIEVIQLRTVDPQLAVLSINKLFGGGGENVDPNKPQIDADPTTGQLIIRATEAQLEQIRSLLEKMGESDSGDEAGVASNVRTIPLTGRAADLALERAQEIWPTMRRNRIRVVTPSSSEIPSFVPGASAPAADGQSPDLPIDLLQGLFGPAPAIEKRSPADTAPPEADPDGATAPENSPPAPAKPTTTPPATATEQPEKSARLHTPGRLGARFVLTAQTTESSSAEPSAETPAPVEAKPGAAAKTPPAPEGAGPSGGEPESPPPKPAKAEPTGEAAPIVVTVGPGGIMIASEDTDALDAFEELLNTLSGSGFAGNTDVTIFYLKNAKADVVAETLDEIFGGGTAEGGGGGGGLLGDIAGAALGDAGGGFLGSLLGIGGAGGGAVAPSGAIQITPDPRLNALVVQANPADTEMVEQLLKILDQKESPEEILVEPKPRVIPLLNAQVSEIAEIVKQVYQDRMIGGGGAGARQPSPQEFIQMLRGGRRGSAGRGSAGGSSADIQQKMAMGIDSRNNALIIVAPDLLYEEVLKLVEKLDEAAGNSSQTMKVVTLERANPEAIQQALSALVGEGVQFGRTSTSARASQPSSSKSSGRSSTNSTPRATPGIPPALQRQIQSRLPRGATAPRSNGSRRGR